MQRLPGAIFQQDNARPHTARVSQDCLRNVTTLPWPASSLDLFPIEQIWDHVGRRVWHLTSLSELEASLQQIYNEMPQDIIQNVNFREETRVNVDMRIGVHSGNVLSGLLGLRKWQFDIWSRDVTIASHMEQSGRPGCVHVSKATKDLLKGQYNIEPGNGNIRDDYLNKLDMETFFITPFKKQPVKDTLYVPANPERSPGYGRRASSINHGKIQRRQSSAVEVLSSRRRTVLGFSDEAHFSLNGYVNKQNCRIWSEANPQVYVETPLHPEKLSVWCALWAGGIIGPYFFKNENVTVNGDRYRAMITNFFIPELNNHDVQELWFQQDGAWPR
ncbi:adenylate cyclase type 5 [Trichonephila clavipes]|nr:adenylate cyclase type 5 [Trichonephila clavipes]